MEEILKTLRALSGETRIKLVRLLSQRELCVCELEYILELSQPAISQQVKILRDAGLAEARREGNWIFYSVPQDNLKEAVQMIADYLTCMPDTQKAEDMQKEWQRFERVLKDPPKHCPDVPRKF